MGRPGAWSNVDLDLSSYLSLQRSQYDAIESDVELSQWPEAR